MNKKLFTICTFLLVSLAGLIFIFSEVKALTSVSDTVNLSWPDTHTSHVISFLTTAPIPAGGRIVLRPEAGTFFIPAGFDYSDVDLATSSLRTGPFADRTLAALPTAVADGVAVTDNSDAGSITITLNASQGIEAGVYVQIELGTNAQYGEFGNREIQNPSELKSYYIDIETLYASGALIKKARTMMAVVEPVLMSSNLGKIRTLGSPMGYLAFGTTETILSLVSNYPATCRYSRTASTSYDSMTEEFTYTVGPSVFHSVLVSNINQTAANNFYIRCEDMGGGKDYPTECVYEIAGNASTTVATSCVDYVVTFNVTSIEDAVGDEVGVPGPGGGGAGGGSGGGLGTTQGSGTGDLLPYPPLPENPGVAFVGWAYPGSKVVILQDGTDVGAMQAKSNAEFGAFLPDLTQGVYTFGIWSDDAQGNRSASYSTTFWIDEGTQTVLSDIFLPPTIKSTVTTLDIGQALQVSGQSVPGATVEVWLYPGASNEINEAKAVKGESLVDSSGNWTLSLGTVSLAASGAYSVSARAIITGTATSDWGRAIALTIGGEAQEEEPSGACAEADLNQDGRVNITDFSILLYYWNTDNACADQNNSGKVDLIDFSIMLYYWTG